MTMKKTIIVIITCVCIAASANAQQGSGRLSLGTGLLYKNGMDITLAYEHEMNYRHMWEFFVNGYLQWAECASCGHICPESFWRNYRSYGFGVAYKPCMTRGLSLIHILNITTVIEGIETKENAEMMVSFGCEYGQGYYYSKPISAKEFTQTYMQ